MTVLTLPTELLENVFSNLSKHDLVALTRTCSAFCEIAQRHLYNDVSLRTTSKSPLVVVALAKTPRLARCVRSFQIRLDHHSPVFNTFYSSLATALANMTGLVKLDLHLWSSPTSVLQEAIASPTSVYRHLLQFTSSLRFDSNVLKFLARTPNLESLSLDAIPSLWEHPHVPSIPFAILPKLSQFAGPLHVALAVVPGRPISNIQVHDGDLTTDLVEILASSATNICVFSASTNSHPLPVLRAISYNMSSLKYLRLMGNPDYLDVPDRSLYLEIADVLYGMPNLAAFELCGMYWDSTAEQISPSQVKRTWTTPFEISFPPFDDSDQFEEEEHPMYFGY